MLFWVPVYLDHNVVLVWSLTVFPLQQVDDFIRGYEPPVSVVLDVALWGVFLSLLAHWILESWTFRFINKELGEYGAVAFKNVFCALPGWRRKTMTYTVTLLDGGSKRRVLQPVAIGLALPLITAFAALVGIVMLLFSIWFWGSWYWNGLLGWIRRAALPQEILAERAEEAREKIHELVNNPENVRLRTLMKDLPPEDEVDFSAFIHHLLSLTRKSQPDLAARDV